MRFLFGLGVCFIAMQSLAASDEDQPFELNAEVGFLTIGGNTESTSLKSKLDIKHDMKDWRTNYLLEGLYKKDTVTTEQEDGSFLTEEDKLSAKKYFFSAQADYKLDEEHRGVFIFASYLYDKFSGYEYQATLAAGYTDILFKTKTQRLNYSIGPGVAYVKPEEANGVDTESEDNPVVRVSMSYRYKFTEGIKFTQDVSTEIAVQSEDNTKSKSVSAVSAQLNSSLALKFSYALTHNSKVIEGIDDTDTEAVVTIVYSM